MKRESQPDGESSQDLTLHEAAELLLEECRMVLPGIQALFGFQLVAVFSSEFAIKLGAGEQRLHLTAIALVGLAVALIMTPAAYHRQTASSSGGRRITRSFLNLSTRLLLWSLLPLALGVCLDFYLIARIILGGGLLVPLLAAAMLAIYLTLWFVLPRSRVLQRVLGGED